MNTLTPSAPIVVGIDGSACSLAALGRAADLAAGLHTFLQVVTCWTVPQFYAEDIDLDSEAFEREARARQDAAVAQGLDGHPPVEVRTTLRRGRTAPELIQASAEAQLLVLGTRGHGEFVHLLLGSVSLECIAHAQCPVLTVRAPHPASQP